MERRICPRFCCSTDPPAMLWSALPACCWSHKRGRRVSSYCSCRSARPSPATRYPCRSLSWWRQACRSRWLQGVATLPPATSWSASPTCCWLVRMRCPTAQVRRRPRLMNRLLYPRFVPPRWGWNIDAADRRLYGRESSDDRGRCFYPHSKRCASQRAVFILYFSAPPPALLRPLNSISSTVGCDAA